MKIGIIGAGTMGVGIAQIFAQNEDFSVMLCSSKKESAISGKKRIEDTLKRLVSSGKIDIDSCENILARITPGLKEDLCADCDLVIESVLEVVEIKQKVFRELDNICKDSCIFATNTSSLSITEIGFGLKHTVVGMHFFNPAPVMKLVEVIEGFSTSKEAIDTVIGICKIIGKTPVLVTEAPGFVVNRILIPMINEAISIYAEGIATVEDIDTAMKLGANHRMGPLELGDLVGLDIVLKIMETMVKETGDTKYRPHPLLKKMVRSRQLGKKTGKGFYKY